MKLFLLIIIILSILGVLEYKAIIPITSFSVLATLDTIASFIKSLHIHSYYLIVPDVTITVQGLLSLFFILFVVGYISDRFINLENKIKSLNKDIKNLSAIKEEPKIVEPEANNEMQQIATEIKGFLETLAKSVTVNPSTPIRSKKLEEYQQKYLVMRLIKMQLQLMKKLNRMLLLIIIKVNLIRLIKLLQLHQMIIYQVLILQKPLSKVTKKIKQKKYC